MFVFTTRLTKKKLAGMIVAAGGLLILIIALIASRSSAQAGKELGPVKGMKTNEDRVAYLEKLGWVVDEQPVSTEEVLIPDEWNDIFENYNAKQQEQGFDLERYRNKRVSRIVYSVKNHPSGQENVEVELLCHKNSIIAGRVQCPSGENGFEHGLSWPAESGLFTAPKPSSEPSAPPSPEDSAAPSGSPQAQMHSPPDCPVQPDGNACSCESDPENCRCENCSH